MGKIHHVLSVSKLKNYLSSSQQIDTFRLLFFFRRCFSALGDIREVEGPQLLSLGEGCIFAGDGRGKLLLTILSTRVDLDGGSCSYNTPRWSVK